MLALRLPPLPSSIDRERARTGFHAQELMIGNEYVCDIKGAASAKMDSFYILDRLSTQEEKKNPERKGTYFQKGMDLRAVKQKLLQTG